MKGKRLVATMLTLLLMVSLLPIGAMADDLPNNTQPQVLINGQIGTNSGTGVGIGENGSVQTNTGSVRENEGTVVNNNGKIVENKKTVVNNVAVKNDSVEDGNISQYKNGTGYIENNYKVVETNGKDGGGAESGIVKSNYGTVGVEGDNTSGNYGTINNNLNGGKVLINQSSGVVDANRKGGTIVTNNGIVGSQGQFGNVEPTSSNYGTVETNNGKVLINQAGGTIETNYGLVGRKDGDNFVTDDGTGNFGEVTTNYGDITYNENLVVTNAKNDATTIPGNIYINDGTVKNNEGTVSDNNGTVETNNGTVEKNYGTVETNAIDGVVNNYSEEPVATYANKDADSSKKEPVVLEGKVEYNFGTVVDKTNPDDEKTYYGLSWGDNIQSLTLLKGDVKAGTTGINLNDYAAKASRSGYKMTGYTAFARKDGEDSQITETANYTMNAPVWLQILWEKLGKSTQPTRTPVYTNLSADQVKVGTFVRCGNMTFKIIEVTDDSIRVATVGKLSDTALADMLGFLKQHLSDAQIAKLIGAPELLEQELVSKFFGGSNEHIAFYASPDLFA